MSLVCPRCSRTLEYSGDRPSFCAYCGQRLSDPSLDETTPYTATPVRRGSDGEAQLTLPHRGLTLGSLAIPERVSSYRLLRALGSGGMGTVYEAEDENTRRRVALKLISAEFVASRDALDRFRQEGRLASMLEHPRCVFVLTADQDEEGRPFIVMELMPGPTLQAYVEEKGPLPVEEAISKILDVIEGLQEAHQLGVIHRDVKPANCFLDHEGRVKVGDFGLSKSLTQDSGLTRSGSFIGTPLYASPEQIKGNPVDVRTDVYSVAATLYFLLAGHPPFQAKDAAATLAKIVSEEPPSLRSERPEIPPALETAIQRGLDRDRDRRYRDLSEFRDALLPFLTSRLSIAGIGLRFFAFLMDAAVFTIALGLIHLLIMRVVASAAPEHLPRIASFLARRDPSIHAFVVLAWILYFALGERFWGYTIGKWLTGLRVTVASVGGPPGFRRALMRAAAFYAIAGLPADMAEFLKPDPGVSDYFGPAETIRRAMILGTPTVLGVVTSGLLLLSTMRAKTGYRGPHEWLTGTRVVLLRGRHRRLVPRTRRRIRQVPVSARRPMGLLETLGPYHIRGAVRWEPDRKVLLGEDPGLGRQVWITMRPRESGSPNDRRHDLIRITRPRWITGGEQGGTRWDAFIAPAGCPLSDLAGPDGLSWSEARPILEDLADELAAACDDGTLPPGLSVEQVWIQPDGRPILVDALGSQEHPTESTNDDERALALFRQVVALALEGGRWRTGTTPRCIHREVPLHVARIFERLCGESLPYNRLADLRNDLHATSHRPSALSRERRVAHLAIQAFLHLPGLAMMFGLCHLALMTHPDVLRENIDFTAGLASMALAWPIIWLAWAIATHGGLSLRLMGIALVRKDSKLAGRLRCGWRSLLVWMPITAALTIAVAEHLGLIRHQFGLAPEFWFWMAAALLPLWVILALVRPTQGIQDRLSGTYLVPE